MISIFIFLLNTSTFAFLSDWFGLNKSSVKEILIHQLQEDQQWLSLALDQRVTPYSDSLRFVFSHILEMPQVIQSSRSDELHRLLLKSLVELPSDMRDEFKEHLSHIYLVDHLDSYAAIEHVGQRQFILLLSDKLLDDTVQKRLSSQFLGNIRASILNNFHVKVKLRAEGKKLSLLSHVLIHEFGHIHSVLNLEIYPWTQEKSVLKGWKNIKFKSFRLKKHPLLRNRRYNPHVNLLTQDEMLSVLSDYSKYDYSIYSYSNEYEFLAERYYCEKLKELNSELFFILVVVGEEEFFLNQCPN